MTFKVPEQYRVTEGQMASDASYGNNGMFEIKHHKLRRVLTVIASDVRGWEHVSVSMPERCPTWDEMCFIKDLFWGPEDWAMQYHPEESEYVNNHPNCLHLWCPIHESFPKPPSILIGIK